MNNPQGNHYQNKESIKKNTLNKNMFEAKEKDNYSNLIKENERKYNINKIQNSKMYNENHNINMIKQNEDYLFRQDNNNNEIQYVNQN